MPAPQKHPNEKKRLHALYEYNILDTLPEKQYDDITRLASQICDSAVSQITLVDDTRQWYKANFGVEMEELPRELGFCSHTILEEDGVLIVPNTTVDHRFHDNPLVTNEPNVAFYAGVSIKSPDGMPIGSVCVVDTKPKDLSESQVASLKSLSNLVIHLFELHKAKDKLVEFTQQLKEQNEELDQFASTAAHDIKSPLNSIVMASEMTNFIYSNQLDDRGRELIDGMNKSARKLSGMINGILEISKNSRSLYDKREAINLGEMLEEIVSLVGNPEHVKISISYDEITANRIALQQIFINMINNSIKHSDKEEVLIDINLKRSEEGCTITFEDNGPGIPESQLEEIFEIFKTTKTDNSGFGIGLATVKRLVEKMGGEIMVSNNVDQGVKFEFTIPEC